MQQQPNGYKPRLWVPGDWNAFKLLGEWWASLPPY